MSEKDLENHVKTRLGSTLTGASKEVRDVFGAGMFSVKKKQKANLFSLSLRENIKQDIKTGRIKTIADLDTIIDKALNTKQITISKTGEEFQEQLVDSATFNVTLPILEKDSHSGKTKAAATLGFGIVGWSLASGSKTKNKIVKNVKVTLHDKGLQIHGSAPDGSNLRIEWDKITEAPQDDKTIKLTLIDGTTILLKAKIQVSKETVEKISNQINEKSCGVVEDGWD